MGRFFSDPVEQALTYLYYDLRAGQGARAMVLLEEASVWEDGDASCLLAQCLHGPRYVWSGHHFAGDDERFRKLMRLSVRQGSALGVLLSLRSRELSDGLGDAMPFASLQEAFDTVREKAQGGEPFCQYAVGNAFYGWDFLRIEDKTEDSFAGAAEYDCYMKEHISACEDWFWKALRGGMHLAADRLNEYYTKGDAPYVQPAPEKAQEPWRVGAELGCPAHQRIWAARLEKEGQFKEALRWYTAAARGGEPETWYDVGRFYEEGLGVQKNLWSALNCYEIGTRNGEAKSGSRRDALRGWG